ncbi:MAG: FAD-dependent oxidoreductase [Candidatus Dormibacteraeota bacterium]|uniref:FAD-dependent oxidoreductase n=1 Tax=Candidatus Amunia macphersoniae TaxID=3127014 RepID=A0A934N9E8_9BACT|nr:FAD-dependent oxidoreductase [Candidatus Dormibacteraeota bacterium]
MSDPSTPTFSRAPRVTRRSLLGGALAAGAGLAIPDVVRAAGPGHAVSAPGSRSCDVVIVGAGLAGLTTARLLAQAGLTVVVVEARDRVGGRTLNHPLGDGRVIEVGGQWVGPLPGEPATATVPAQAVYKPQSRIYALAKQVGIGTFKTYNSGKYVDFSNGNRTTYDSSTRIPADLSAPNAGLGLGLLNQMAAQIDTNAPYNHPKALQWDQQSVETWMRENLPPGPGLAADAQLPPTSPDRQLINLAIESVFSAEPRDISLLHVLWYIANAGTFDNLIDTANGAQDSRFIGGSQQISINVANALGDAVLLSAPVRSITQSGSGVVVKGDNFSVSASRVVVTIPPHLNLGIDYEPSLSRFDGGLRDQLVQRAPMGSVIKVQCLYSHPFWRSQGLAGQATSDTGPVKITFDNTPYPDDGTAGASPGVLIGFIEGSDGRVWMQRSAADRRAAVVASMARYFGVEANNLTGYVEMLWPQERWTGGCYGAFFPTGVWTSYGTALRAPLGAVHWAGTETATTWAGYMDGAVQSAERVTAEVLAAAGLTPAGGPPTVLPESMLGAVALPVLGTAAAVAVARHRVQNPAGG